MSECPLKRLGGFAYRGEKSLEEISLVGFIIDYIFSLFISSISSRSPKNVTQ